MGFDSSYMVDVVEAKFSGSNRAQLSQIFANYKASGNRYLIIHIHGGLVDRDEAIDGAIQLQALYSPVASTLFPIWETGIFEVLQRNWEQIGADALYQILIDRVSGAVHAKATGPDDGMLTRTLPAIGLNELRESAQGPGEFAGVDTSTWGSTELLSHDERKTFQHRLQGDHELVSGIRHVAAAHHAAVASGGLRGLLDEGVALATDFVEGLIQKAGDLLGFPSTVILEIIDVVDAVLQRFKDRTDHGLHATVTEEILRKFYVDLLGFEVWKQMKNYTVDAFGPDGQQYFGTALIEEFAGLDAANKRILLVGHSAGSIYACQILQQAKKQNIAAPIDIVFLAAAVHDDLFAETIDAAGPFSNFRSFSMSDTLEQNDNLLGGIGDGTLDWVYPRSLLYLISGALEATVDAPLAGLQRDIDLAWQGANLPSVVTARNLLLQPGSNHAVWSTTQIPGQDRLSANAIDHGDFGHPFLSSGNTAGQPNWSVRGVAQIAQTAVF
jgi:hypothetical protein